MTNPSNGASATILANNPLECPIPPEILLKNPPLKLALAQIRFPPVLAINQQNSPHVAAFQEAVRAEYPDYRADAGLSIVLGPQGAQASPAPSIHHRFENKDGWGITLTQDFVALATSCYHNREDFAAKVGNMSKAVREHIKPHQAKRLGVRFVDSIEGNTLQDAPKYIDPAYWGALSVLRNSAQSFMTESVLNGPDETTMLARWGLIPANHQIPSTSIPPINEPCWVLDSDVHTAQLSDFNPEELADCTKRLSGRIYAFFRKVFNDDFIRHCGGEL